MTGYRLLPRAEEEMIEAADFYEAAAAGLGADFLDDIQHAIDDARSRPGLGTAVGYGLRRMLVRRFPFSIVYAVEPGHILVVAVAHQRRRPGYWRDRS